MRLGFPARAVPEPDLAWPGPGAPASWLRPARTDEPEWLDQGAGTAADVAANLDEMERVNRYLGGHAALTAHLYPRLLAARGPVRLIDLGTGGAGLPRLVVDWSRAQGLSVRILALDRAARHLAVARRRSAAYPEILFLQGDIGDLPLAASGVDYVVSSLVLHHFNPPEAVALLRAAYGHARRGVLISDLIRGRLPYWAFRLSQPVFARNYLTRHDGGLSVQRAYTPGELMALARAAGLRGARVHVHWPWRMTLVADR